MRRFKANMSTHKYGSAHASPWAPCASRPAGTAARGTAATLGARAELSDVHVPPELHGGVASSAFPAGRTPIVPETAEQDGGVGVAAATSPCGDQRCALVAGEIRREATSSPASTIQPDTCVWMSGRDRGRHRVQPGWRWAGAARDTPSTVGVRDHLLRVRDDVVVATRTRPPAAVYADVNLRAPLIHVPV